MGVRILHGDCRAILPILPDGSVQCVVTSPPYWALRDYGVEGQLGLEPTPEAYVAAMVGVFREVRRVLRDDGTCWLNLGDSYNAYNGNRGASPSISANAEEATPDLPGGYGLTCKTLKPKDLVGMPWRLAFALQADGWYLRADIIWAKPNPMPESVTDRPTKAHEYVFLLSKSARYFYDADAVREPQDEPWRSTGKPERGGLIGDARGMDRIFTRREYNPAGRNLRSVWTINPEPFPDAHFATFPTALAARCIRAGTSERGACGACGAPWVRQIEREPGFAARRVYEQGLRGQRHGAALDANYRGVGCTRSQTLGWHPSCACAAPVVPCVVLDPFGGSGTVGAVAEQHGRHSILIELSPAYVRMAEQRTAQRGLFTQATAPACEVAG